MARLLARTFIGALALVLATGGAFAVLADQRPASYILPGTSVFPEDVAFQNSTGDFFVSSAGEGEILRGNIADANSAHTFIPATGMQFATIGLKLDDAGRLIVAGGMAGEIRVYESATGRHLRTLTTGGGSFLNDLAVAPNGDAFVTDSFRPVLWRVPAADLVASSTQVPAQAWLDLSSSPMHYQAGFNANGIVASPDGQFLVVAQTNTGELFRIDIATRQVVQIDLGGQLVAGDGIALRGRTLFAQANGEIVKIAMSADFSSGSVLSRTSDPSFAFPTTIALARGRMLVVNSQFDKLLSAQPPVLPFTVSSIAIP